MTIELGRTVKELRVKRGYTQVELAEKLDTTQPEISKLERGGRDDSYPLASLFALADALGVSYTKLLQEAARENV
jgi:transcriptional regulator with XRE-family HTH domain